MEGKEREMWLVKDQRIKLGKDQDMYCWERSRDVVKRKRRI